MPSGPGLPIGSRHKKLHRLRINRPRPVLRYSQKDLRIPEIPGCRFLFAALPGLRADGADFIDEAVERGAVAILARCDVDITERIGDPQRARQIAKLHDHNPHKRFSVLAAQFYQAQPDVIAAVTGTNGKTSVASFTRQIWTEMGCRAASMGTLGGVWPDGLKRLRYTTPGPITIFSTLKKLVEDKVDHLVMETSSHGLDQFRVDGVRLKAAAFTNLTQDHLDYHASVEDYLYAKLRLFGEVLPPGGVAVLNADADLPIDVESLCWGRGQRILAVGARAPEKGRHIKLSRCRPNAQGQHLEIFWDGTTFEVNLPLVGAFQASNALMAAGLVLACGGKPAEVFKALDTVEGVPGRLQFIGHTQARAPVFIDYAHTPDAIANVLHALRPHTDGRLHIVFGAGGDRDRAKRPLMGKVADELADVAIVTDDNPRTEKPSTIRAEILKSAPGAMEIGNRAKAIDRAIADLAPGDVLIIAGKGHETGQIIGDKVIPFSDEEEVRRSLKLQGGAE